MQWILAAFGIELCTVTSTKPTSKTPQMSKMKKVSIWNNVGK